MAYTKPLGYAQDTSISSASALPSIPAGARAAIIQASGGDIRWRDDGTNPTTSIGMLLVDGNSFLYTGDETTEGALTAFRVISAAGEVNVSYYA